MNFWERFEKETEDLEKENERQTAEIVEKAKERNKQLEERWEKMSRLKIQITKCYLVQVLDEAGNELKCEYSFGNTKKEAEDVGNRLLREAVDDDNRK